MTTGAGMKIALLQLNPTVGDLDGNAARIADAVRQATAAGAQLCVTPELSLIGYPPRDLLLNGSFIERAGQVIADLARRLQGHAPTLVGAPAVNRGQGRPLFNATMLLKDGTVEAVFRKSLLPTYDVFDEDRYFEPADGVSILELDGRRFAVSVCEDVWGDGTAGESARRYHVDPLWTLKGQRLEGIINVSASPFVAGKQDQRERLLASLARRVGAPVFYVNQVGGNDDLVFDGRSVVFDADGRLRARAAAFAEDTVMADLPRLAGAGISMGLSADDEMWQSLVLGTRDYARKCGFSTALLGLSGGIDSALVAAIACEALGPDSVEGILLPSPWTSRASVDDAEALAARLGMRTRTIPISPMMDACAGALAPHFQNTRRDTTEENVQARIRGMMLMALANKYGALLLTTGNKSELAVGYCTLYGDMAGGLAVIADVPKTIVFRLSRWLNQRGQGELIPQAIIDKAPSAELRPGQTDQDDLPPYSVLDDVLDRHLQDHLSADELIASGYPAPIVHRVLRLVATAEFKRRQAAPGLKVTDRAFGTGWRMPVARRIA